MDELTVRSTSRSSAEVSDIALRETTMTRLVFRPMLVDNPREQAAAVKPGMSRVQVRDILGTPLLVSVFHSDRWDYVFTFKRQGLAPQARNVTVFFKGDALERIEADALPSEAEFVASLDSGRKSGKVPVLEMTEESMKQLPAPTKIAEPKPLPPLPASYPPLEPAVR